ncbi:hypothetical protein [Luteolibacter sp. LG18]|uniref:hypothetical protein n=1 Tax=Luteolibacter sp. LG18 TaxID=2819286 RepID=UPI0030C6DE19
MALIPATALMAASCSYPNQFVNTPQATPHAVVEAEKPVHFFADNLEIIEINGQPTSFWRSSTRFLIPPGRTSLGVILSSRSTRAGFRPGGSLAFDARVGDHFTLHRDLSGGKDHVSVIRHRNGLRDQTVAGHLIAED